MWSVNNQFFKASKNPVKCRKEQARYRCFQDPSIVVYKPPISVIELPSIFAFSTNTKAAGKLLWFSEIVEGDSEK